ncbi:hypothetical protein AB8A05_06115 [Tardiphaga sp. 538_B7_N1_4]|uniref:hypothetical protein n=1 Tax=Tardiphaga sp. 538_B7_N1_4 TaxID=3240778 RepID=UPI003F26BCF7
MKVSLARLNESRELRDIALTLLDRHGSNVVLVDRNRQIKTRQLDVGDLHIMQSAPMGEHILDVYHGRKVFSVNWNDVDAIEVVAFKSGDWRQLLRASGIKTSGWSNAGAPQNVKEASGPAFVTREGLQKRLETFITETYSVAEDHEPAKRIGCAGQH